MTSYLVMTCSFAAVRCDVSHVSKAALPVLRVVKADVVEYCPLPPPAGIFTPTYVSANADMRLESLAAHTFHPHHTSRQS